MAERLSCEHGEHRARSLAVDAAVLERASGIFRALGDPARLRLLEYLTHGECCVSELVEAFGEKFSTISQRLRLLRAERLIVRRREGTHLFYALADQHVIDLIQNALAHADEPGKGPRPPRGRTAKEPRK